MTEQALEEIYRRFGPAIFRRCRLLLVDEAEAHDALQDIFLILHAKLGTFRGEAQPMTWIYRVATNHCLNRLRSTRARHRLSERAPAPEPPALDPAMTLERREIVSSLFDRLSPRQVQIAVHRYLDEMTQPEIAEVLELSERTVRSELRRIEDCAREVTDRLAQLAEVL